MTFCPKHFVVRPLFFNCTAFSDFVCHKIDQHAIRKTLLPAGCHIHFTTDMSQSIKDNFVNVIIICFSWHSLLNLFNVFEIKIKMFLTFSFLEIR